MFDISKLADSRNKYAVLALNLAAGVALITAASWFSYNLFSTRDEALAPRVINSVTLDPTILLAGKSFTIRSNVTLNKLCPYEEHWSLARKADGVEVVKIIEPVRPPATQLGTQDLPPITRFVPTGIEPGEYRYVAEVLDLCPGVHAISSARLGQTIVVR